MFSRQCLCCCKDGKTLERFQAVVQRCLIVTIKFIERLSPCQKEGEKSQPTLSNKQGSEGGSHSSLIVDHAHLVDK